jgi:hypothetical protein
MGDIDISSTTTKTGNEKKSNNTEIKINIATKPATK